ncbi:MAG: VWA domain-containing protein [Roseiflexaceae bacterium]
MPSLYVIEPQVLWLFCIIPIIWATGILGRWRLSRRRRLASIALRTVSVVAVILALSGLHSSSIPNTTTVLFALDASDSVSLSQRARAEGFIQEALRTIGPDDQAGIIVFGNDALIERRPSDSAQLGQISILPQGNATNLANALQLSTALLPAEGSRRIVLLSDGGETKGDGLAEAQRLSTLGIPIDVVPLSNAVDGPDAQITSASLPASVRAGQRPRMTIGLLSNQEGNGQLIIEGPGGVLVNQSVVLTTSEQRLEVVLPEPLPGFNRYVVRIGIGDDTRPQNNASEVFTFVISQPRALIIEGVAGEATQLATAWQATGLEVVVIPPEQAPTQIAELANYDLTALVNVSRKSIPEATASALSAYVYDLGRGLLMVGGPQSFGAGGWRESPIEAALPVEMDLPPLKQVAPVSIVVVIDISGSMSQEENGRTKLSLALEGAQQIAALMRDEDELTVIPFDSAAQQVVGPLPGTRRNDAIRALERVNGGGGGINIHDALVEAAKVSRASTHPIRHIITLTDGSDTVQQEGALDLVQGLRAEGVTVSTIAIGSGSDVPFIEQAASVGGGRTFLTERAADLPRLLLDETQQILKPYLVEEEFLPARGLPHPALRLDQAAPPLYGFVLTNPKETAQILLADPEQQVVMAAWQYGIGRSVVWTSDLTGRWGRDWVSWSGFPPMAAQIAAWLLPTANSQVLELASATNTGVLELDVRANNTSGEALTGLQVIAQLYGSNQQRNDYSMHEVAPGRYRITIADQAPGAYLVQLVARTPDGEPVATLTAGVVMPLSTEYRSQTANRGLLEQIARLSGGRIDPQPQQSFERGGMAGGAATPLSLPLLWLALLLLPLDIAIRRLTWTWRRNQPALQPSPIPPVVAPPATQASTPVRPLPPPKPAATSKEAALERLREAQEQARKRARGEE